MTGEGPPHPDGRVQLTSYDSESERVAALAVATWLAIDEELTPIIGTKGVAAVFRRSLFLTRDTHPSLAAVRAGANTADARLELRLALLAQPSVDAHATHVALLQTFRELLASLIGPSLTERLLLPVWTSLANGNPVQDHTR